MSEEEGIENFEDFETWIRETVNDLVSSYNNFDSEKNLHGIKIKYRDHINPEDSIYDFKHPIKVKKENFIKAANKIIFAAKEYAHNTRYSYINFLSFAS